MAEPETKNLQTDKKKRTPRKKANAPEPKLETMLWAAAFDPCCGSGGMFVQSEKFCMTRRRSPEICKSDLPVVFLPTADAIQSGSYLLDDGACGTGGMLTVAEETLLSLALDRGKQVIPHLYGLLGESVKVAAQ